MATHSMTRRAVAHDYTKTGIYHITLHVADGLWQPLGDVVGDAMAPDGMPDAPRVDMTPIGQMVEYELLHSIHEHYPMVIVDTYIIMPDHLHFILEVQDKIISRNGKLLLRALFSSVPASHLVNERLSMKVLITAFP